MSYYDNIKLINIIYIECIRKLCLIILVFNAFTDNIVTQKFLKNVKKGSPKKAQMPKFSTLQ